MAAPADAAPVAVQEAAAPARGPKREPGAGAPKTHVEEAPEKDVDDDEDDELYEQILDEVEAFEYSTNGASGCHISCIY
jgi:NAD-dependent histone deacetylase SIR2